MRMNSELHVFSRRPHLHRQHALGDQLSRPRACDTHAEHPTALGLEYQFREALRPIDGDGSADGSPWKLRDVDIDALLGGSSGAAGVSHGDGKVRPAADQAIHAPREQPSHVRLVIHGPHLYLEISLVRVTDEAGRHNSNQIGPFRNLVTAVRCATHRPPGQRTIYREARFGTTCAGCHFRERGPRGCRAACAKSGNAHPIGGTSRPDFSGHGFSHVARIYLHLNDEWHVRVRPQHIAERRDPDPLAPERKVATPDESIASIDPRQIRGRSRHHRTRGLGRAVQRRVVVYHRHAIGRQMHVQFQAVGADPDSQIEGGERIFRTERRASTVREHERPPEVKERHVPLV